MPSAGITAGWFRSSQPRKPESGLGACCLGPVPEVGRKQLVFDGQQHLQGVGLARAGEGVVGLNSFLQREAARGEPGRINLPGRHALGRVGVENVSTRPVVMVTPLIYSDSRCSVAGLPCTPTLAIWPDPLGALLEGLRDPDRLHRHVGAKAVGELVDLAASTPGGS
jgi:hypothetical protein